MVYARKIYLSLNGARKVIVDRRNDALDKFEEKQEILRRLSRFPALVEVLNDLEHDTGVFAWVNRRLHRLYVRVLLHSDSFIQVVLHNILKNFLSCGTPLS